MCTDVFGLALALPWLGLGLAFAFALPWLVLGLGLALPVLCLRICFALALPFVHNFLLDFQTEHYHYAVAALRRYLQQASKMKDLDS